MSNVWDRHLMKAQHVRSHKLPAVVLHMCCMFVYACAGITLQTISTVTHDLHIPEIIRPRDSQSHKTQHNATHLIQSLSKKKLAASGRCVLGDVLPTESLRQLSWLGRITHTNDYKNNSLTIYTSCIVNVQH